MSRLSWKWRERSPAKIAEGTHEGATEALQRRGELAAETIRFVLADRGLRDRCTDLLLRKMHHDRAVREATTILEDRIRRLTGIKGLTAAALVGKAINPEPSKAVIEVSAEAGEQRGFHSICQGLVQVFRNKFHHSISDGFTQADALRVCGFIDTVLAVLAGATIHKDRATT